MQIHRDMNYDSYLNLSKIVTGRDYLSFPISSVGRSRYQEYISLLSSEILNETQIKKICLPEKVINVGSFSPMMLEEIQFDTEIYHKISLKNISNLKKVAFNDRYFCEDESAIYSKDMKTIVLYKPHMQNILVDIKIEILKDYCFEFCDKLKIIYLPFDSKIKTLPICIEAEKVILSKNIKNVYESIIREIVAPYDAQRVIVKSSIDYGYRKLTVILKSNATIEIGHVDCDIKRVDDISSYLEDFTYLVNPDPSPGGVMFDIVSSERNNQESKCANKTNSRSQVDDQNLFSIFNQAKQELNDDTNPFDKPAPINKSSMFEKSKPKMSSISNIEIIQRKAENSQIVQKSYIHEKSVISDYIIDFSVLRKIKKISKGAFGVVYLMEDENKHELCSEGD